MFKIHDKKINVHLSYALLHYIRVSDNQKYNTKYPETDTTASEIKQ